MTTGAPDLRVEGATEHNLRDLDVTFPRGITAVVGVSGSGKSSLVFDTVYREARRRFLEAGSLASRADVGPPAHVRAIHGLRPAVAISQNTVNRNPRSTVATALGVHPLLRLLYARFAARRCLECARLATVASSEAQASALRALADASGPAAPVRVIAGMVRRAEGSHGRLLAHLAERFGPGAVEVDGRAWDGTPLDPDLPHAIDVHVASVGAGGSPRAARAAIDSVTDLGALLVRLEGGGERHTLTRAPLCAGCGARLPSARPQEFRDGGGEAEAYELSGLRLSQLLGLEARAAARALGAAALPPRATVVAVQVRHRLDLLCDVGLGYLSLDRPSPTLSRGEGQRLRLAVLLANEVEDLLHVVDEPTIGLDPDQVGALMAQLERLPGPVLLVEHDRAAVAGADHVIELGPGAATGGGQVVFEGTPAALWRAGTPSGRWFSGADRLERSAPRSPGPDRLTVRGAGLHNLTGVDCEFPVGALTVVTGPSGAGKTTLVRDVLVASLDAGEPRGCDAVAGPALRTLAVDQSPIGRSPRSNPATYTGLADRLRTWFAEATGLAGSTFSFNRPEGACEACHGMGATEVRLRFLQSEWVVCDACQGRRFSDEVLAVRATLGDGRRHSIEDVLAATVDDAVALFAGDRRAQRILASLQDVGLGYLRLGQPSPTLSGGEAQRVKLAKQLATSRPAQLVYLDEPTTGLHPANLPQLAAILQRLVERGCTVVVVEHDAEVVALADWVVRLGPGGGPDGGRLIHAGPSDGGGPAPAVVRPRARPRRGRPAHAAVEVRDATANNLRHVTVSIPKQGVTAVVGVSGSGKSSLVRDVLAAEATRRLLEGMSMYERQSVRAGPGGAAAAVTGLGPTVAIGTERERAHPRRTVGTCTEISEHLAVLLAHAGARSCARCGGAQRRRVAAGGPWRCRECGEEGPPAEVSDFSPATYEGACLGCQGMGTVAKPRLDRLVVRPELPICGGALYSPGFYPRSYHCRSPNGGFWTLLGLADRFGFDPFETPWRDLTDAARDAFLFGELEVAVPPEAGRSAFEGRTGPDTATWLGFFRTVGGWDVGGLYTDRVPCPECGGGRLRPQFLEVRVGGMNRADLHGAPVVDVLARLTGAGVPDTAPALAGRAHAVACRRLEFLARIGLGYLHLDRPSATLSGGEAQRVELASLLGADLVAQTVLLDEPTRGLHPREVDVLAATLLGLAAGGNAVVVVDHEPRLVSRADHHVVLGPGAGRLGGTVVAAGPAAEVRAVPAARPLLVHPVPARAVGPRRAPAGWMTVRAPTANNLRGGDVAMPLGVLAGLCGVSGSGKSTLAIDIVVRALAPRRVTTSVASTPVDPGAHEAIDGAPAKVVHTDQSPVGIRSPGDFLKVMRPLREAYADTAAAALLRLGVDDLVPRCDACRGRGSVADDLGFMETVRDPCDACAGSGYRAEVRGLVVRGASLPELERASLDEVAERWHDVDRVARPLRIAQRLGLGYLALGQVAGALSGGERQRLKIVRELAKKVSAPALYVLDEPTAGLHAADVARLVDTLDGLVRSGHSVLVVDHDPVLLACCDWLVELGPGGGPDGGCVVASGPPGELARGATPTAPYLAEVLA